MTGKGSFSDALKPDAVAQFTERGYPVAEVAQPLSVSQHSLYTWKKNCSQPAGRDAREFESWRLKRELAKVSEDAIF